MKTLWKFLRWLSYRWSVAYPPRKNWNDGTQPHGPTTPAPTPSSRPAKRNEDDSI